MRPTIKHAVAGTLALALVATACGDDGNEADDSPAATTTEMTGETTETTETTDAAPATTDDTSTDTTTDMSSAVPETTEAAPGTTHDMDMSTTDTTDTTEATDDMGAMATTDDGASTLRAGLTSLLQEHVYLAGIAIETAVDAGGDLEDPAVQAAVATLDANSVALSEAVGSVAGPDDAEAFLGLWREHIGFFVDYTLGAATGDQAVKDQALADLAGYQQAAGAFFEEITGGEIVADELVAGLDMHVSTLTVAIDGVVAGDAAAFTDLRAAAQHMFEAALFLSAGIANAVPDMFPGDVTSAPAETRAVLTNLLQEHVYLAGIAIEQAVEAGGDLENPAVQAAVATLDENSVALSEVIGSVAGPENAEAFLGLWREHIGFFVDYTLGMATGDQAMADEALANLDGYQEAAGAFFEEITGGELPSDAVVTSLDEHVATLTAAIDSLLAGDVAAFDDLRTAAQHMPMAALAISTAVVAATS
jgi:hypothetical protein